MILGNKYFPDGCVLVYFLVVVNKAADPSVGLLSHHLGEWSIQTQMVDFYLHKSDNLHVKIEVLNSQ